MLEKKKRISEELKPKKFDQASEEERRVMYNIALIYFADTYKSGFFKPDSLKEKMKFFSGFTGMEESEMRAAYEYLMNHVMKLALKDQGFKIGFLQEEKEKNDTE